MTPGGDYGCDVAGAHPRCRNAQSLHLHLRRADESVIVERHAAKLPRQPLQCNRLGRWIVGSGRSPSAPSRFAGGPGSLFSQ